MHNHAFMRDGDAFPSEPLGSPIRPKSEPMDPNSPEAWVKQASGTYRNKVTGKLATEIPKPPAKPVTLTIPLLITCHTPGSLIETWVKLAFKARQTTPPIRSDREIQGSVTGRMVSSSPSYQELPRRVNPGIDQKARDLVAAWRSQYLSEYEAEPEPRYIARVVAETYYDQEVSAPSYMSEEDRS